MGHLRLYHFYHTVLLITLFLISTPFVKGNGNQFNGASNPQYYFGTLMSNPDRAAGHVASGINTASLTIRWDSFEPQEGVISESYVQQIQQYITKFKNAGSNIVLDFGMHYPPQWVTQVPYCRYVNQFGDAYIVTNDPGRNVLNGVFNQVVRDKMAAYVGRVFSRINPQNFFAIRIGWGHYAELHYPDKNFAGKKNCYWGYDSIATNKVSGYLPAGVQLNPVPNWIPGVASPNNQNARAFIEWYLNSLTNFQTFQISTIRQFFNGYINVLYADWGVRTGHIEEAIAVNLNGTSFSEQYFQLQKGHDHARFIAAIADSNVVVFNTCLNSNYPFPMTVSIVDENSTDPKNWSPIHYLSWCIAQHQLPLKLWAENDGNDNYEAMQRSFQRMTTYNLMGIMWAFEHNLYSDDPIYAHLDEYVNLIAEYNTTGVQDPGLLTNIVLYPNPADKLLTLKGNGENAGRKYGIFSVEGKLMLQGVLMPESTTIHIEKLPKGIYLLKINDNKLQVHRFTKY